MQKNHISATCMCFSAAISRVYRTISANYCYYKMSISAKTTTNPHDRTHQ